MTQLIQAAWSWGCVRGRRSRLWNGSDECGCSCLCWPPRVSIRPSTASAVLQTLARSSRVFPAGSDSWNARPTVTLGETDPFGHDIRPGAAPDCSRLGRIR